MPVHVAILGTDALLAVWPVEPLQLTRACHAAGFDLVAPVSWGEELIANHLGDRMAAANGIAAVASSCPFVSVSLLAAQARTTVFSTVSPPVACARYLREVFRLQPLHLTYVGACPGALSPEIDDRCLPEVFLRRLLEAGIDPSRQPRHLDARLPVERARYASVAGGVPHAEWLMARTGARLVEAAPITVDVVAESLPEHGVLMDLASACRCFCGRDRAAGARLEPPRASAPVVGSVPVSVVDGPPDPAPVTTEHGQETAVREHVKPDRRATFAENGLSAGDASSLTSIPENPTQTRDPW